MIGGNRDLGAQARRELEGLFAGSSGLERAQAWAGRVLEQEGADPARAPLRAAGVLRRAEGRLSRVAARYLVEMVAGRGQRAGHDPGRPLLS